MSLLRKPILLRSSRLAKRRRRALYFKAAAIVFVVLSFAGTAGYLLRQPEVTIREVSVEGNEVISAKELEALARGELQGNYLFLFPRSNIFIFPKGNIETHILTTYKRIESVDVSRRGFTGIDVKVSERHPFALWCRGENGVSVEPAGTSSEAVIETPVQFEECHFLDGEGYIFTKAPGFTGNLYFIYRGELVGDEPAGTQFLTREEFGEMRLFLNAIRDLEITPVSLNKTFENEFELTLKGGAQILFGADQNLARALNNLESALGTDIFHEKDLLEVEYIDLRFGNKVYYRFK